MPGGDRTGPAGMGPMTGRGMGRCAGVGVPESANRGLGQGRGGRGGGGRRGWRNMLHATGLTGRQRDAMNASPSDLSAAVTTTTEQEVEVLKQQAEVMANTLDDIRQRIGEIQGQQPQTQQAAE